MGSRSKQNNERDWTVNKKAKKLRDQGLAWEKVGEKIGYSANHAKNLCLRFERYIAHVEARKELEIEKKNIQKVKLKSPPMKQVNFYATAPMLRGLKEISAVTNTAVGELVRKAVNAFLNEEFARVGGISNLFDENGKIKGTHEQDGNVK